LFGGGDTGGSSAVTETWHAGIDDEVLAEPESPGARRTKAAAQCGPGQAPGLHAGLGCPCREKLACAAGEKGEWVIVSV